MFGSIKNMLVIALVGSALIMTACGSKKKADDLDGSGVDSSAMSFDASGSDSGNIAGLRSLNFSYDSAVLSAEAKRIAQSNADWMQANPRANIQIEGHCDARGSIEYNLSLGERRANAVKNYMVSLGVAGNRLSVISYGKEKPLGFGDSESDYARNRRANFLPISQ